MKKYTYKDSDMYDIYPPGSEVGITHTESICMRCKNFTRDKEGLAACKHKKKKEFLNSLFSGECELLDVK